MTDADLIREAREWDYNVGGTLITRLAAALEQRSAQLEVENEQHHTLQRSFNTLEAQFEERGAQLEQYKADYALDLNAMANRALAAEQERDRMRARWEQVPHSLRYAIDQILAAK